MKGTRWRYVVVRVMKWVALRCGMMSVFLLRS